MEDVNREMKLRNLYLIFLLTGCQSNNFIDWYEAELTLTPRVLTKTEVKVIETLRYQEKIKSLTDQGYVIVGTSMFKGGWEPRYLAVEAAMQYGATVVVITSKTVGSVTQNYNVTVPRENVGVYRGSNGSHGTFIGVSAQNVSGSYSFDLLEQKATFLAKRIMNNEKICVIFLFLSGCASHTYYYPNIPKDYAVSEVTEKENQKLVFP